MNVSVAVPPPPPIQYVDVCLRYWTGEGDGMAEKVDRINHALQARGLRTKVDDGVEDGNAENVHARCVLIFITQRYITQARSRSGAAGGGKKAEN